jgi:glycosyltransferase involved in cell wall biosynthesis
MKIALIVQRFPHGGAESYVEEIAQRLYKKGQDVTIISSINKESNDRQYPFRIIRLPKLVSIGEYSFWRGLGRLLKKEKFDLVHVNTYGYFHSDYAAFLKKKLGYKLVLTGHGFTGMDLHDLRKNKTIRKSSPFDIIRPLYDKKIGKKTIKSCDNLIALSKKDYEFYIQAGVDKSKIVIIPPGIKETFFSESKNDIDKIKTKYGDGPILLSVGELSWIKSQATMIRAMSFVIKQKPSITLLILGKNRTELDNLKQLSKNLGVEKNVFFLGLQDSQEVKKYMHAADILLNTSLAEGLSTILLEAMACGLPFITTPSGGNGYLAQESGAGLTVPFEDEKTLANHILALTSDRKKMHEMGSKGSIFAKDLGWDAVFKKIAKVYDNLLGSDKN